MSDFQKSYLLDLIATVSGYYYIVCQLWMRVQKCSIVSRVDTSKQVLVDCAPLVTRCFSYSKQSCRIQHLSFLAGRVVSTAYTRLLLVRVIILLKENLWMSATLHLSNFVFFIYVCNFFSSENSYFSFLHAIGMPADILRMFEWLIMQ